MIILYFGDVFGKPGRNAVRAALPNLVANYTPDFVFCNAENLAGGRGVNKRTFEEMVQMGFHGFTSGNHIWDNKEVYSIMETDERLLRPANYLSPPDMPCPGKGWRIFRNAGCELAVINLMGRLFMDPMDCPFAAADRILKEIPSHVPVFVDMHADATSEKYAMGFHLDGRVAAVVGSHSHVQTADERLLPKGTAYITDVGMSGSFDSVIGLRHTEIVKRFLTKRPIPTGPSKENPGVGCVIIKIGLNNRATSIERLRFSVEAQGLHDDRDLD
jgi:2',3'-cyclic-nucleotide 2'-phosphodiesterase